MENALENTFKRALGVINNDEMGPKRPDKINNCQPLVGRVSKGQLSKGRLDMALVAAEVGTHDPGIY